MDEVIAAAYFAVLDEEALVTIVDDVWGDQGPPMTPLRAFELATQAQDNTLSTDANVPEACSTCTTSPTDQEQEPKKKRRRDRNRPWHEIAQLQSESAELERQLEQHLTSSSKKARRALLKRNENTILKRMLQEGVEDTQTLEHNLFRQVNELVQSLPRSLVMTRNLQYDGARDDMVFRLMANSVDAQYKDMDRVMRRAGLVGLQTEVMDSYVGRATSVYTGGVTGELLKFRSRILSPFSSCTLEGAFWRGIEAGLGAAMGTPHSPSDVELPLGMASRITAQKYEIAVGEYACIMRMVVKKFMENGRAVQVWNMVADWPRVGTLHNVRTQEYGWGYIQPLRNGTSDCACRILMSPTINGLPPNESCEATKSLTKSYQDMIMSRLQALENQTMDQLVREKRALQRGKV